MNQLPGGIGLFTGVHGKTVGGSFELPQGDFHPGLEEQLSVQPAFLGQRVAFGGDHQGRRQISQIRCINRRNQRIAGILGERR